MSKEILIVKKEMFIYEISIIVCRKLEFVGPIQQKITPQFQIIVPTQLINFWFLCQTPFSSLDPPA